MDRRRVAELASAAGFGGNQRNTLSVKLETLCVLAEKDAMARHAGLLIELQAFVRRVHIYEGGKPDKHDILTKIGDAVKEATRV